MSLRRFRIHMGRRESRGEYRLPWLQDRATYLLLIMSQGRSARHCNMRAHERSLTPWQIRCALDWTIQRALKYSQTYFSTEALGGRLGTGLTNETHGNDLAAFGWRHAATAACSDCPHLLERRVGTGAA